MHQGDETPAPGDTRRVAALTSGAGISRSNFAATFKIHVGTTPADYLTHWRIALAQNQLHQDDSIKAIADALGYANPSSLSRVFTQAVGLSPRGWLQNAR